MILLFEKGKKKKILGLFNQKKREDTNNYTSKQNYFNHGTKKKMLGNGTPLWDVCTIVFKSAMIFNLLSLHSRNFFDTTQHIYICVSTCH